MKTLTISMALAVGLTTAGLAQNNPAGSPNQQDQNQINRNDRIGAPAQGQGQGLNREGRLGADRTAASGQSTEFLKKAAKNGVMELKVARMAAEKAQNPGVKQFAQTLITDHSRANQQIMQLAARKGVTLPQDLQQQLSQGASGIATDRSRTETDATADRQPVREATGDAARDATRDRLNTRDLQREPATGAGRQPATGAPATETTEHAGKEGKEHGEDHMAMQKLQGLSGTEFDRAFIQQQIKHHEKGVKEFEQASQSLDDPEVKAFAASTLPTLRQHLQQARSLSSSVGGTVPDAQPGQRESAPDQNKRD